MSYPSNEDLERAGMVDESGHLLGGAAQSLVGIPREVRLGEGTIEWEGRARRRPRQGALDSFVRLNTPGDVLAFVRQHGVIGFCQHGLPPNTRPLRGHDDSVPAVEAALCGSVLTADGWASEEAQLYLTLAGSFRAVLELSALVHQRSVRIRDGDPRLEPVWKALPQFQWIGRGQPDGLQAARGRLSVVMSAWLRDAGVPLMLEWDQNGARLEFGGLTYARLLLDLAQAVSIGDYAVCSACQIAYRRTGRQVKSGQNNFCGECGGKAGEWNFRYRHRARDERGAIKG